MNPNGRPPRRWNDRADALGLWSAPTKQQHDLVGEFAALQWANLHDSSCAGRVCLNPDHMPEGGRVIDVRPADKLDNSDTPANPDT